jgi:hypothetical protein
MQLGVYPSHLSVFETREMSKNIKPSNKIPIKAMLEEIVKT